MQPEEARISMLTSVIKYVSIVVLVLGFSWNLPVDSQKLPVSNGPYMELISFLVCLSAILVVTHGFREPKHFCQQCRPLTELVG